MFNLDEMEYKTNNFWNKWKEWVGESRLVKCVLMRFFFLDMEWHVCRFVFEFLLFFVCCLFILFVWANRLRSIWNETSTYDVILQYNTFPDKNRLSFTSFFYHWQSSFFFLSSDFFFRFCLFWLPAAKNNLHISKFHWICLYWLLFYIVRILRIVLIVINLCIDSVAFSVVSFMHFRTFYFTIFVYRRLINSTFCSYRNLCIDHFGVRKWQFGWDTIWF